jgi:proton-dependent oligopeptide transporter, POT family
VSFMMAVWFLSSSIAQYVGGIIAGAMGTETVGGQVLDPAAALATSLDGFNKLGWAGVGCGVVFIALSFFIKQWAHGVNDPENHPQPEPIAPVLDGERQAVSPAAVRADKKA